MARKLDMGVDSSQEIPKPIFKVTNNLGDAGETDIMHIYAPTTAAQRTATQDLAPIGSTTNDETSGLAYVNTGGAWALV